MYLDPLERMPGEVVPVTPPIKTIKLEPWRQLLLEAADILERRGWCQKHLIDVRGRMCTVGAMTSVWDIEADWDMSVVSEAQDELTKVVGPLVEWNDTKGRTKEEVLKTLRYVARLEHRL